MVCGLLPPPFHPNWMRKIRILSTIWSGLVCTGSSSPEACGWGRWAGRGCRKLFTDVRYWKFTCALYSEHTLPPTDAVYQRPKMRISRATQTQTNNKVYPETLALALVTSEWWIDLSLPDTESERESERRLCCCPNRNAQLIAPSTEGARNSRPVCSPCSLQRQRQWPAAASDQRPAALKIRSDDYLRNPTTYLQGTTADAEIYVGHTRRPAHARACTSFSLRYRRVYFKTRCRGTDMDGLSFGIGLLFAMLVMILVEHVRPRNRYSVFDWFLMYTIYHCRQSIRKQITEPTRYKHSFAFSENIHIYWFTNINQIKELVALGTNQYSSYLGLQILHTIGKYSNI